MAKKINFSDLIIFENEDYIGINKPPFIATLNDRVNDQNILEMARGVYPDCQVCHRIDKETSGALVIAKHNEAYRNLAMQFEDRVVTKEYHALVDGIHNFKNEEVNLPIKQLRHGVVKIDFSKGKAANTEFNSLAIYKNHTLVQCLPATGRMHQIRIHLSKLDAPIICDEQYGGKILYLSSIKRKFNLKQETEEEPLMKRFALHARSITFYDMKEEELTITAPYPKDFSVLVKQLEKNSR